jgi:hypothetical protein
MAFAHAVITLRRLIRCAWTLHRGTPDPNDALNPTAYPRAL